MSPTRGTDKAAKPFEKAIVAIPHGSLFFSSNKKGKKKTLYKLLGSVLLVLVLVLAAFISFHYLFRHEWDYLSHQIKRGQNQNMN